MNFSKMSSLELRALQKNINQELKKREQKELRKARDQINKIAKSVGVPIKELMGVRARAAKNDAAAEVSVQYRHPDDASLKWTGRGRQPQWIKEWVESGKTLDDVRV